MGQAGTPRSFQPELTGHCWVSARQGHSTFGHPLFFGCRRSGGVGTPPPQIWAQTLHWVLSLEEVDLKTQLVGLGKLSEAAASKEQKQETGAIAQL